MSKVSKPCWDAARYLQNMPEWTGVAAPRAAAFIFDNSCQVGPTRRFSATKITVSVTQGHDMVARKLRRSEHSTCVSGTAALVLQRIS